MSKNKSIDCLIELFCDCTIFYFNNKKVKVNTTKFWESIKEVEKKYKVNLAISPRLIFNKKYLTTKTNKKTNQKTNFLF